MKVALQKFILCVCLFGLGIVFTPPAQAARAGGGNFNVIIITPKPVVSRF